MQLLVIQFIIKMFHIRLNGSSHTIVVEISILQNHKNLKILSCLHSNGLKSFVVTILTKSVCVVAIFRVLILKLLSCWPSMYSNVNIIVSNIKII
jgi:hypothetical protein